MKEKETLSIILPCYNEEDVLSKTWERLLSLEEKIKEYELEFVFVDDGSTDGTYDILINLRPRFSRVKIISFSRNFGHQIAVSAGIDKCNGDLAVIMDSDLQDPPEIIIDMLRLYEDGYHVVYGQRVSRRGETNFKRLSAHLFYRLLNKISEVHIPVDTGDFRLISYEVIEAFRKMPEYSRFVRGMISWIGYRQIALRYERDERAAGITKYPLKKMILFALNGVLSFSTAPLKAVTRLGTILISVSFIGVLYALYMRIFTQSWVEGWTALIISILLLGGLQILTLGLIGEYISRIFNQSQGRPLYIINEEIDN